jgi:signal transduction histidine kinase
LTNVARHAQAKKVQVDLTDGDGQLLLVVRDDGIGIPTEKVDNTKSLGLLGIRERALLLDGDVAIERAETGGTSVTVRVPIN